MKMLGSMKSLLTIDGSPPTLMPSTIDNSNPSSAGPVRSTQRRSVSYAANFPLLFVVLLLVAVPVSAQTLGTITGEVKDASGAIIPGATVTVTNTGTNATREMPSNESGIYTFPALPPGPYMVKSELQGFQTVDAEGRAARRGEPSA